MLFLISSHNFGVKNKKDETILEKIDKIISPVIIDENKDDNKIDVDAKNILERITFLFSFTITLLKTF